MEGIEVTVFSLSILLLLVTYIFVHFRIQNLYSALENLASSLGKIIQKELERTERKIYINRNLITDLEHRVEFLEKN